MSQVIFDTINPSTTSGTQLATILNDFKAAIVSGMSGTSRPTELEAGGGWVDTTDANLWIYNVYTGTNDVAIFTVNLTTGKSSFSGSDSTFEISRISADTVGPIAKFIKQRIATNGQVLAGDIVGEMQFVGRGSDSSNPIVARIRAYASDNMGAAASGAYFVFETTPSGQTAAAEHMRLIGGNLGIGTQTPTARVHAEGATGVKSSYNADSANPAIMTLEKSRVAGTKATQNADDIGEIVVNTTDSLSALAKSASIKATATQAHTDTARGTKIVVATTDDGAASVSDKLSISSEIESIVRLKMNSLQLVGQSQATTATIAQLSAAKAVVEFTGSTTTSVQGINSAHASKVVLLHNISTADITLEHENASATAADRLKLPYSTPITIPPQSSIELFYSVTDSRWKLKSGSGSGTGSGSGGKNYASLLFAGTSFNGINTYDDSAAAVPVDGTGGTATGLTTTLNTSTPLRGTSNIRFSKDGSNRQGKGWSWDFTLDRADYEGGKPVTIQFRFKPSSGYVAGDVRMFVYDKDGSLLLNVGSSSGDGSIAKSDATTMFTGSFFPNPANNDYRVIFHVASTTAAAWDLDLADLIVGPNSVLPGAIISDWKEYPATLAGFGTATGVSVYSRRNGDTLEVHGTLTSGTATATLASMTLGFNGANGNITAAGTDKIKAGGHIAGSGYFSVANAVAFTAIAVPSDNKLYFGAQYATQAGFASANGNTIASSGQTISFYARIPIAGWTSGSLVSSTETMLQTTKVRAYNSSTTLTSGVTTNIVFSAEDQDLSSSFDGTTFTAPKTAAYRYTARLKVGSSWTAGNSAQLWVEKNASGAIIYGYSIVRLDATTSANRTIISTDTVYMVKGDTLKLRANVDGTGPAIAGTTENYWAIEEVPDLSIFGTYGVFETLSATSATRVPGASGQHYVVTGNSLTLSPGTWRLYGQVEFGNGGTAPPYQSVIANWRSAPGADSGTLPAALSAAAGVTVLSSYGSTQLNFQSPNANSHTLPAPEVILRCTSPVTVYLVPFATMTTAGDASIICYPNAERLQ